MSQRLNGKNPLSYLGVNPVTPPGFRVFDDAPTVNDSKNFLLGQIWLQRNTQNLWLLTSLADGLATWTQFAGGGAVVESLTGDDGVRVAPVANNINLFATPNAGSTVRFNANLPGELDLKVTDAFDNTIVGLSAGNLTLTGSSSTGLGKLVLHALTTGNNNVAAGDHSMFSATSAADCVSIGSSSGRALTMGSRNTFVGHASGISAINASDCVALGYQALDSAINSSGVIAIGSLAGSAYDGREDDNIVIGNIGVASENNTIRIGTRATHTRFFAAGVDGVSVGNTANVVTEVGDQLGTAVLTAGTGIALNLSPNVIEIEATGSVSGNPVAFFATENVEANVTGDGTLFHIGAAVPMNIVQNIGGGFYPGDGAGTPASFTAPVTGTYLLTYFLASNVTVGGGTPGGTVQGWYIDNGGSLLGVMNGPTGNQVTGFYGGGGFWDQNGAVAVPLNAGDVITWAFIAGTQSKTTSTAAGSVSGVLLGTLNNGGGANSFPTDAGVATPLAGVLNVLATATAGASVEFSGTGHTVALNVTDSHSNTLIGLGAGGVAITAADSNVALGAQCGSGLTSGSNNILIGTGVGSAITSGTGNFLCGDSGTVAALAGTATVNGLYAFGASTGAGATPSTLFFHNYGGGQAGNTFVGYNSGSSLNAGQTGMNLDNTGCGQSSLEDLTTGSENSALGYQAGANITSGRGSVLLGRDAGLNLLTGNFCTLVGLAAGNAYVGAEANNIIVGNTAGTAAESNTMRLGNDGSLGGTTLTARAFAYGIRGVTTGVNDAVAVLVDSAGQLGTVSSSARYKENIEDMGDESSAIMNLRPVKFNYKERSGLETGLIAEEVAEVMPRLVVCNKEGEIESVKYHELNSLLLNELQKLAKRVAELESRLN